MEKLAFIVASVPYYVFAASAAFQAVDRSFERASLSLGRTPTRTFVSITLPLTFRGLSTGIAMAFARAIVAFGAVIVIAYYPSLPCADMACASRARSSTTTYRMEDCEA